VKVQYPGIAETIAADLRNVALLRRMLRITAPSQDVDALLTELRERVLEELDYRREADNQRLFAAYYDGHPTIHIPGIISELSTRRMVTSELSDGARFAEMAGWSQHERDLAAETIYRFVFRSLYEVRAFNGDPHPGNYLFHGGGRVTFLDFGLVKHFTTAELQPLMQLARTLCVDDDPAAFRRSLEDAGFLRPDAPLSTETIVERLEPAGDLAAPSHGHWFHRSGVSTQVFVVESMPPPPAGLAYVAWYRRDGAGWTRAGAFTLDGQGYGRIIEVDANGDGIGEVAIVRQPPTSTTLDGTVVLHWTNVPSVR
jgi:hypothetical protein